MRKNLKVLFSFVLTLCLLMGFASQVTFAYDQYSAPPPTIVGHVPGYSDCAPYNTAYGYDWRVISDTTNHTYESDGRQETAAEITLNGSTSQQVTIGGKLKSVLELSAQFGFTISAGAKISFVLERYCYDQFSNNTKTYQLYLGNSSYPFRPAFYGSTDRKMSYSINHKWVGHTYTGWEIKRMR